MMKFPIFSLTRAIFLTPEEAENLAVDPRTGLVIFLHESSSDSACLNATYTHHRRFDLVCASEYDQETDGNKYLLMQKHWPGKQVHKMLPPHSDDLNKAHAGCGTVLKYFERPASGLDRIFLGIPRGSCYKDLSDPNTPGCVLVRNEYALKAGVYYILSPHQVEVTGETHVVV